MKNYGTSKSRSVGISITLVGTAGLGRANWVGNATSLWSTLSQSRLMRESLDMNLQTSFTHAAHATVANGRHLPSIKKAEGGTFLDLCEVDYEEHFKEQDGELVGLSPAARFMIDKLRLNDENAIRYRRQRKLAKEYVKRIHAIRMKLRRLRLDKKKAKSQAIEELESLGEILESHANFIMSLLPRRRD